MLFRVLVGVGLLVLATEAAALRRADQTECPGLPGYFMSCGDYGGSANVCCDGRYAEGMRSMCAHPQAEGAKCVHSSESTRLSGPTWFKSRPDTNLTRRSDGSVRWEMLQKPDVLITYFEPSKLGKGDTVTKVVNWTSDGENSCPSKDWDDHKFCKDDEPCMHTSVNCLAGTGDFRIFFGDTAGAAKVTQDGFANTTSYSGMNKLMESPPFSEYKGYDFRTFPHVSSKAERYVPKQSRSTAVPCSINRKDSSAMFGKSRLMYSGCFEVPLRKQTPMKLSLHKLSSGHIEVSMSMNGHTLKVTDDKVSSKDAPSAIDVIAIEYPNSRKYTFVELGLPE